MKNNIPSLRIAVTDNCNLNCPYCPKSGDSYLIKDNYLLKEKDFKKIINIAYLVGIKHFSITGGEPLLVPNLTFNLAKQINSFSNLGYLRLNTNGTLLIKYISEIVSSNFSLVKVSLDSLKDINFQQILYGIKMLKSYNIDVRINTVVSYMNLSEFEDFIKLNQDLGTELKLFDITYYEDKNSLRSNYWQENFVSLMPIIKNLEKRFGKPDNFYSVGGYGNPMSTFKSGLNSEIKIRSTEKSAFYMDVCKNCSNYMCQDGLSNITLSYDGYLKPCRPKGLNLNLRLIDNSGNLISENKIKNKFQKIIKLFQNSKEVERNLDKLKTNQKNN